MRRYCGNLPDWYNDLLNQADSLLLSRDQVDTLRAARTSYRAKLLAHWGVFAGRLDATPDQYVLKELVQAQTDVTDAARDIARTEAQTMLPKVLTPVQLKILPGNSRFIFESKEPIRGTRFFSSLAC